MALVIEGLSKTYPNGVQALKHLSLNIGNHMFGLLGPNGADKSSLMRTIATLQEPDAGSITLDGIDVVRQKDEVRRVLGYGFYVQPIFWSIAYWTAIFALLGVLSLALDKARHRDRPGCAREAGVEAGGALGAGGAGLPARRHRCRRLVLLQHPPAAGMADGGPGHANAPSLPSIRRTS